MFISNPDGFSENPSVNSNLAFFLSIPWTRDLINSIHSNNESASTNTKTRSGPTSVHSPDSPIRRRQVYSLFFSTTLCSYASISHTLTLLRLSSAVAYDGKPLLKTSVQSEKSSNSSASTNVDKPALVEELVLLLHLGEALDGYPGVAHGGVVATILDETMGLFIGTNAERGGASLVSSSSSWSSSAVGSEEQTSSSDGYIDGKTTRSNLIKAERFNPDALIKVSVTVEMTVKYRRPVSTPQVVAVRAWLEDLNSLLDANEKKKKPKYWVRSQIEDSNGKVLAEGRALFVQNPMMASTVQPKGGEKL